jgi:hypothetical protein
LGASALKRFFDELPWPIDHVMVTAGGPDYRSTLPIGRVVGPADVARSPSTS